MTFGVSGASASSYTTVSNSGDSNSAVSKDEFLRLLTYQLKAQNPLKPYNNQEFATQLAQFSQLEQLTDIRGLMEEQAGSNSLLTETIANTALPGMLGKTAKAYTDKFKVDGENKVNLGFNSPYNSAEGEIRIRNENGDIVKTLELGAAGLSSGDHTINWDKTTNDGSTAPNGTYSFEVILTNANGSTSNADTFINGKIDAVRFKSEGTLLVINGLEVTLNSIADISSGN
jgi:flagellar basal-body rod modification protein FlgD